VEIGAMSPTPEQQKKMEDATLIILWAIALAGLAVLFIWSLPDWSWLEHRWIEILSWGGYGHG